MKEDTSRMEQIHKVEVSDKRAKKALVVLVSFACILLAAITLLSLWSDYRQYQYSKTRAIVVNNEISGVKKLLQEQDQYFLCRLSESATQTPKTPNTCPLPFQGD